MDKEYYSIDNLNTDILSIISQVRSANLKIDIILSVNRGGCIPGVYLSHGLKLPHKVIDLQLRDGKNIPNSNSVKNLKINSKKILIIDDINDTGSTFIHLNRIINNNNTKKYGSSNGKIEEYLDKKGWKTLINLWPDKVFTKK